MNELLRVDAAYATAATDMGNRPLLAKLWPSLYFYSRFLGVVFRASSEVKSGGYDGRSWSESSLEVLRLLELIGLRINISGLQELTGFDGPCVIIANHMSMMETLILPVMVQPLKPVTFVIKESLLNYPVFKHVMRSRDPVAVTRNNPRQDLKIVLEEGEKRLRQGVSIIVFPQTTRTNSFDPAQMSSIGVKLAKKTDVPIVPLALKTDAWTNGRYLKDFGKLNVRQEVFFAFGPHIRVAGKGNEEQQLVVDYIAGKLAGWQEK